MLAALENRARGRAITDFRPEEVYDIARELGVSVADVPALVFFTAPKKRADTLVLRLGDFVPDDVSDADLTDFFRSLAAICRRVRCPLQAEPSQTRTVMRCKWLDEVRRNRFDTPVTPEVAGSSPVAPPL
jgi:hypothetical protein